MDRLKHTRRLSDPRNESARHGDLPRQRFGLTDSPKGEASEDPEDCPLGRFRHVIDVRDVRCQINDEPAKAAAAEGGGLPYG